MRRNLFRKTALMAVLVAWVGLLPGLGFAKGVSAIKQRVELLLVQNSRGVAIDKDNRTLTLQGVSPTTLFFSDRPVRIAGHFNKEDYLKLWGEGKESFRTDPPNATLSVFEEGQDDLLDVVVKLQNPRYQGDDLIYDITIIEGQLPKAGGPSSLFIDIFGVWRRAARRTVWIGAAATTAAVATTATAAEAGAAAAAAQPTTVTVQETAPPPPAPQQTADQKLKGLKTMLDQGLITQSEYDAKRQQILASF